jgi:triosephosphate isomerase
MSREKTTIIGNWKMNLNVQEASLYLHKLAEAVKVRRDVEVILAPTTLTLQTLSMQVNRRQFKLAAQNMYWRDNGAFTGEVSARQLHGVVDYVLIGHSERRHIFNETEKDIRNKVQAAIRNRIKPVLLIGETSYERANGETEAVLQDQLVGGLLNLTSEEIDEVIIGYEPVWAIGTGEHAMPEDVTRAIKSIRNHLKHLYGKKVADQTPVLYGGSVKADSAVDYLNLDEVDGLVIGGASIDFHAFTDIIKLAHRSSASRDD